MLRFQGLSGSRRESLKGKRPMAEEKSFEASLKELEQIVEQLEAGNLSLERSLELFEKGVRLSRECQGRLDEAERKVEMLIKGRDGSARTAPFKEPEND